MADKPRGRPRRDDSVSEVIRVRVTPAQRLELRRVARENGTLVSEVIREAVDEYVCDYRESGIFRGTKRLGQRTMNK